MALSIRLFRCFDRYYLGIGGIAGCLGADSHDFVVVCLSVGNRYSAQAVASIEGVITNTDNTEGDMDIYHTPAERESFRSDGGDGVWNLDAGQVDTFIECFISDRRHTIFNDNGIDGLAVSVPGGRKESFKFHRTGTVDRKDIVISEGPGQILATVSAETVYLKNRNVSK